MFTISILFILIILLFLIICGKIWKILSFFHEKNYTFFDFIFLIIYFAEQFLFLLLYNLSIEYRGLWVGLIVLSVITTASLDRFMMNIRQRKSSKTIRDSLEERKDLLGIIDNQENEIKLLRNENNSLMDFIRENLQKKS